MKKKLISNSNLEIVLCKNDSHISDLYSAENGFAGFDTLDNLKSHLSYYNTISFKKETYCKIDFSTLKERINKIFELLKPNGKLYIYLFLVDNDFIKDRLGNIGGFTPFKNTIHLYLNKEYTKVDFENLYSTLIHEYTHSQFYHYHSWKTVRDGLLAEGFAEYFTEKITGRRSIFYSEDAPDLYRKIIKYLDSEEYSIYNSIFEEDGIFPLWTGYSVGYWLFESFVKAYDANWLEIIKSLNFNSLIKQKSEGN